mgnify:FL=1
MKEDSLLTIISVGIPSIISIVGFIVTYFSMKQSFQNELKRNRDTLALENMSKIPYKVLALFDEMIEINSLKNAKLKEKKQEENLKIFKEIMNTIYSYGSKESIKIVSLMQKENYEAAVKKITQNEYRMMAIYVLLATQIKYDVTSVAVSPRYWFIMKLNDFDSQEKRISEATNQLIDELGIDKNFMM